MLMQIGQKPESDFSEPIGMLEDCHKRIRYFLGLLVTLSHAAGTAPLSVADRDSLERSLFYFREAGPRHNADEEQSLFPEMRRHSEASAVLDSLASLEADHRWADEQHREIEAIGNSWLAAGVLSEGDRGRLQALVQPLLNFYEHHIELEETEIFPAARRILSAAEKVKVGKGMAERRGLQVHPNANARA